MPTEDTNWIEEGESVVQIDEHNLDRECVRLPSQYLRHAHHAADLKHDLDEASAELDVVKAEVAKEVRDNPAIFGLEKATENGIKEAVLTSKAYRKALRAYNEKKHEQELAQAIVWALEHKKRTLTLLVELHGMGYFSDPKISQRGKTAVQEMTRTAVNAKARKRLRDDD